MLWEFIAGKRIDRLDHYLVTYSKKAINYTFQALFITGHAPTPFFSPREFD
jgi:hypothetical protein